MKKAKNKIIFRIKEDVDGALICSKCRRRIDASRGGGCLSGTKWVCYECDPTLSEKMMKKFYDDYKVLPPKIKRQVVREMSKTFFISSLFLDMISRKRKRKEEERPHYIG